MLSKMNLKVVSRAASRSPGMRIVLVLFLTPFLASCFVTTDRLAVYERDTLSSKEIEALAGDYHRTEENGALSSLSFTVRDKPWLYRKVNKGFGGTPPFFPAKAISLAAAEMTLKTEGGPEGGSGMVEGVAVFSKIPGSDLILIGVPGETSKVTIDGETTDYATLGVVNAAQSKNLFFVLEPSDEGFGLNMFFEDDEALKKAFASLSKPLSTERLLTYLKDNSGEVSHKSNTLQFSKSSPAQRAIFTQKIESALKRDAENKLRAAAPKPESQAKAKTTTPPAPKASSDKIQSIDSFFQVSKDSISEFKVQRVMADGSYEYIALLRARVFRRRAFRPNELVEQGVWHPDTQQFHYQARLKTTNGKCVSWNEANWSHPFVTTKLYHVNGRTMDAWASSAIAPRPANRDKKKICIEQELNADDCSVVRCRKRANYTSTDITYLVQSQADAFWLYHHHFGNP